MNFCLPSHTLYLSVQYQKCEDERNMSVCQKTAQSPTCSLFFLSLAWCILNFIQDSLWPFLVFRTYLPYHNAMDRHKYRPFIASSLLLHALVLFVEITSKPLSKSVMKLAPKCMHLRWCLCLPVFPRSAKHHTSRTMASTAHSHFVMIMKLQLPINVFSLPLLLSSSFKHTS